MNLPPVDLSTPVPVLHDRLADLLRREGNLDHCGVRCSLKDLPDCTCLACPVSLSDDESEGNAHKAALCRIGKEQERTATLLMVKQRSGG